MCPNPLAIRPNGACTCGGGSQPTKTIASDPMTPDTLQRAVEVIQPEEVFARPLMKRRW